MLIILPPSETKRPALDHGRPVDLAALSFPELTPMRERMLDAVIGTRAGPTAANWLNVKSSMGFEIARNTALREIPAMAAAEVYTGPLHQGLSIETLSTRAREYAERSTVITSALWGLLRLDDRIPPYRLSLYSRLAGVGERTDHAWRRVLPDVLATVAKREPVILDLRSPEFQSIGTPTGLDDRTVMLRVERHAPGRRIGDVVAKRTRGTAARYLLESGFEPQSPDELASIIGERWSAELSGGARGVSTVTLITRG